MSNYCNNNSAVIRLILRDTNKSVVECSKVLGISMQYTHTLLNNPYKLTLAQVFTLAGFLNMPPLELFARIQHNAKSKKAQEQITTQLKNLLENTILTPKDL